MTQKFRRALQTQTLLKISQIVLRTSQTYKMSKTVKVEFFRKYYFLINFVEESNNSTTTLPSELCLHKLYQYQLLQ